MKIVEAFKELFTGYNMTNAGGQGRKEKDVLFVNKESIQYTNMDRRKLTKKIISSDIKNKYYMQEKDILISLKKPYRVGTYINLEIWKDNKIIVPNNYMILRGIDEDKYNYIFIANYLEKIGIENYVKEKNIEGELKKTDIEDIDLPDVPLKNQEKIISLINNINERSTIYEKILENDDKIIKYALKEVIGENYDR